MWLSLRTGRSFFGWIELGKAKGKGRDTFHPRLTTNWTCRDRYTPIERSRFGVAVVLEGMKEKRRDAFLPGPASGPAGPGLSPQPFDQCARYFVLYYLDTDY